MMDDDDSSVMDWDELFVSPVVTDENIQDLVDEYVNDNNPNAYLAISAWDVSNVTNLDYLFDGMTDFNLPIGKWDVSNVTSMVGTFFNCKSFNQPLEWWDMSKVKNTSEMFANCTSFNQPLLQWDVSGVTNMESMFYNCKQFNQWLSSWNVSNVKSVAHMFEGCIRFQLFEHGVLSCWRLPVNCNKFDWNARILFPKSSRVVFPVTDMGRDIVDQSDSTVLSHLSQSDSAIAIYVQHTVYLTDKEYLTYATTNKEMKNSNIKFECLQLNSMNLNNIVMNVPYLAMRSVGLFGLVLLSRIHEIISNPKLRVFEMRPIGKHLSSVASLQVLGPNPNMVSASHCQDGQGDDVYDLFTVIAKESKVGGFSKKKGYQRRKRTKKCGVK